MTLGLAIVQARSWGIRLKMIWRILTQGQMVIICPVIAIESSGQARPRPRARTCARSRSTTRMSSMLDPVICCALYAVFWAGWAMGRYA